MICSVKCTHSLRSIIASLLNCYTTGTTGTTTPAVGIFGTGLRVSSGGNTVVLEGAEKK